MSIRFKHLLSLTTSFALISTGATAQSIDDIGDMPGGAVESVGYGISGSGNAIVGRGVSVSGYEAFRWTLGTGIVGLGDLPGGFFDSEATASNANGSVVVGIGYSTQREAFRWVDGVGMVGLGWLPGSTGFSEALGVNAAGNVVVGRGENASFNYEAFRWVDGVGMSGLGELAGGLDYSSAYATNDAGNIVVGMSQSINGSEAFRWVDGVGMVGLGDLAGGGFSSIAFDVNASGNVVVGEGTTASAFEAFRWVDGVGMSSLGGLPGFFQSRANGVNAAGNIVVGFSDGPAGQEAVYWQDGVGMEALSTVLATAGVNMTGWMLYDARGVDDTGNIVTGYGAFGGNTVAFIANVVTGGVTTPAALASGLGSAVIPARQTQSALSNNLAQSLFSATHSIVPLKSDVINIARPESIAPAAGGDIARNWSAFAVGSFGIGHDNDTDNHAVNGTTGISVQLSDDLSIGAGVLGSTGRTELEYDGKSSLDAIGASVLAAYEDPSGLRVYGTAFLADIQIETNRRYLNGGGTDGSQGEIDGIGYGAAVRMGWEMPVGMHTSFMPYLEVDASKIHLDDYTESGGAFPAAFGSQTEEQLTSRFGVQVERQIDAKLSVGGRLTVAQRITGGNQGLNASAAGFSGIINSSEASQRWVEGTVSGDWNFASDSSLNMELTGRTNRNQDPMATLTVGLRIGF